MMYFYRCCAAVVLPLVLFCCGCGATKPQSTSSASTSPAAEATNVAEASTARGDVGKTAALSSETVAEESVVPRSAPTESNAPAGEADATESSATGSDSSVPEETLDIDVSGEPTLEEEIKRLVAAIDPMPGDLVEPIDEEVHLQLVAFGLLRIGEPAIPAMIQAIEGGSPKQRARLAVLVAKIEGDEKLAALPAIIKNLDFRHEDAESQENVVANCIGALGMIGPLKWTPLFGPRG